MRFLGRLGMGYGLGDAVPGLTQHCLVLRPRGSQVKSVLESVQCSHQGVDGSMGQQDHGCGSRPEPLC